jgi:hypothetical protein
MQHQYIATTTDDFIPQLESTITEAYTWGNGAVIFFAACLLAAGLISWFIHRS